MDILLQQVSSGCFWNTDGWVPEMDRAKVFASSGKAIDFCLAHRMKGIRLVFHFTDSREDIYLKEFPARAWWGDGHDDCPEEAKVEELAAVKESLREQQNRLESDIEKAVSDIDAVNQRLRFARKAARLRTDEARR